MRYGIQIVIIHVERRTEMKRYTFIAQKDALVDNHALLEPRFALPVFQESDLAKTSSMVAWNRVGMDVAFIQKRRLCLSASVIA